MRNLSNDDRNKPDNVSVSPKLDRRTEAPDRRQVWRGGRRATDWPRTSPGEPLQLQNDSVVRFERKTG
jgi:hypothetical protein